MDVTNFIVKDDSPLKLHKNVAIAKSGIYQYHITELGGLFDNNVEIPNQHKSRTIFNVYRPKEVLKDAKNLFVQLPLTREHPEDFVTPDNIKDEKTGWIGWTGDSSTVAILETDSEITINSTLNIVDKIGMKSYDRGIREVSPGYAADFNWKDGVDKNGTEYQIVMTKINEVNHLALVDNGRGGKDASILDSKKEFEMDKETKGLFDKFMSLFKNEKKILDSMPKDIEKFTDEQKEYLLKETHRLLRHRISGKSFDSFMPIGYTKDDMDMAEDAPNQESTAGGEHEKSEGDEAGGSTGTITPKSDKENVTEKEDGAADALPEKETAAHEKIKEGLKEDVEADKEETKDDDGDVIDAPAEQTAFHGMDTVEPTKVVSSNAAASTQPQAPVRAKDSTITVKISDSRVNDGFDPFAIVGQIKSGFGSSLKSGGMSQTKKESK